MKVSLDTCNIITTLHQVGFTDDFVFHGDDIFWVQKKMYLDPAKCTLTEYQRLTDAKGNEVVVFALVAFYHNVMGILLKQNKITNERYKRKFQKQMDSLLPFVGL